MSDFGPSSFNAFCLHCHCVAKDSPAHLFFWYRLRFPKQINGQVACKICPEKMRFYYISCFLPSVLGFCTCFIFIYFHDVLLFLGLSRLNRLGKRGPPLSINADLMALADSLNQDGTAGAEGTTNFSRFQFKRAFIRT